MHNIILKIFLLIVFFFFGTANAQDFQKVHELIIQGQEDIFNVDFDAAALKFRQAKELAPKDLRGPFFESTLYFWKSMLTRNKDDYKTYMSMADRIIDQCEELLDKNENDLDARFYLGWTHAIRGVIVYFVDRNVFKAGYDLKDANKQLTYIIERDKNYYDAYMGLGLYNYSISMIPRKYQTLTNLLGFEGNKETGKNQLTLAAEKGIYTNYEAKLYMAFLSWREENYPVSENYAQQVLNKFPKSPAAWMVWGLLMNQQDKLNESIQAYEKAIEYNKGKESDIVLKNSYGALGTAYFRLNQFEKAVDNSVKYFTYLTNDDRKNNRIHALGVSLEFLGRRNEALNYYKKVKTELDDDNDWEKYWLRKVNERIASPLLPIDSMLIVADNFRAASNISDAAKTYDYMFQNLYATADQDLKLQINHGYASLLFKNKDYNKAIEYFKQNITLKPQREMWLVPEAYFQIGRSYLRLGNKNEAIKYFDLAEDIDYDFDFKGSLDTKIKNELSNN
jgi:tetratricopeptide (TPR) repeat protein